MQGKAPAREIGDMAMARMRWIERPAEQADTNGVAMAEAGNRIRVQGRTCPVPSTW